MEAIRIREAKLILIETRRIERIRIIEERRIIQETLTIKITA